jgi:hypothetical protein
MYLHANAKLGLAGRLALVAAVEDGLSLRQAAVTFAVSPGLPIAGGIAGCREIVGREHWLIARAGRMARRGYSRPSWRSGSASVEVRLDGARAWLVERPALPTRLSGRCFAGRDLAPAAIGQGPGAPLRMALPGRPAAHGHKPLRALPDTGPPSDRRSLPLRRWLDATGDASRLRLRPRDRRRPLAACLRRAPPGREGGDRHRLCRTGARLLPRARHRLQAADDRQQLQLRQEPLSARAAQMPFRRWRRRQSNLRSPGIPASSHRGCFAPN